MNLGNNEICRFQNVGLQWKYEKYISMPTQVCLLNYHSFTFTARLIIFVYYLYAFVLLIQLLYSEVPDNLHYQATHSHY